MVRSNGHPLVVPQPPQGFEGFRAVDKQPLADVVDGEPLPA
jgi:hypothetical protein